MDECKPLVVTLGEGESMLKVVQKGWRGEHEEEEVHTNKGTSWGGH
jgi:hypothetical protein